MAPVLRSHDHGAFKSQGVSPVSKDLSPESPYPRKHGRPQRAQAQHQRQADQGFTRPNVQAGKGPVGSNLSSAPSAMTEGFQRARRKLRNRGRGQLSPRHGDKRVSIHTP